MWITEAAIDAWTAVPRSTPGGQATYPDGAIQTCLMLRAAFKLPQRQDKGLVTLFIEFPGCELAVPDHTTVSRRAIKLSLIALAALPEDPLHVLINSTRLKVYAAGEWLAGKAQIGGNPRDPLRHRNLHAIARRAAAGHRNLCAGGERDQRAQTSNNAAGKEETDARDRAHPAAHPAAASCFHLHAGLPDYGARRYVCAKLLLCNRTNVLLKSLEGYSV